jgi:hypothetical protein
MACGAVIASGIQVESYRSSGIHRVSESRHFMCRFPDKEISGRGKY